MSLSLRLLSLARRESSYYVYILRGRASLCEYAALDQLTNQFAAVTCTVHMYIDTL